MSYNNTEYTHRQQFVDPQGSSQQGSSNQGRRSSHAAAPPPRGYRSVDPALLTPGAAHIIPYQPYVSPEMVRAGQQAQIFQTRLFILPRTAEYAGNPSIESITFSVQGEPAPYIKAIMEERVTVDAPYDHIFEDSGWKRTKIAVAAHGTATRPTRPSLTESGGSHITRKMLADFLCARIFELFKNNDAVARVTKWRYIRLVALSYYRDVWVPVLAIDA